MSNVLKSKGAIVFAIAVLLCALLVAVPAYAFYYVHDDEVSESNTGKGAYEVFCIVDETAVGGAIKSDLMFVPAGSTAEEVLSEAIYSSENQNGLENIHNYDVQSVADYLKAKGYNYTIDVYETGESNSYDNYRDADAATGEDLYGYSAYGNADTVVNRYDNIYVTVTEQLKHPEKLSDDQTGAFSSFKRIQNTPHITNDLIFYKKGKEFSYMTECLC